MNEVKEVFKFYEDIVKPSYSEIQARGNSLPVELLFEIHAAFDHLKRIYLNGEEASNQSEKAVSHLKRCVFDASKLTLKYFNEDIQRIEKSVDLSLIDTGEYERNYIDSLEEIRNLAKEARIEESNNHNEAFKKWWEVLTLIKTFREQFFTNKKIEWAKRKSTKIITKERVITFLLGCFSSSIVAVIIYFISLKN